MIRWSIMKKNTDNIELAFDIQLAGKVADETGLLMDLAGYIDNTELMYWYIEHGNRDGFTV